MTIPNSIKTQVNAADERAKETEHAVKSEKQKRAKLQHRFEERHRKDLEKLATLASKVESLNNDLAQSRIESADMTHEIP